jgi:type II secretory pathway pseudopilin PulG
MMSPTKLLTEINRARASRRHEGKMSPPHKYEAGFTLVEFLISCLVFLVVSAAVFIMASDLQNTAAYQAEMQLVAGNAQIALQTVARSIRQAGNNPLGVNLAGVKIISSTEVQIQSDLTGSLGPGNPDKGDPDGDINDSGENITIRYNKTARTLEYLVGGGATQIIAGNISSFSLKYYDADGHQTVSGKDVRKIRIAVQSTSLLPNPRTHKPFGMEIASDIQIAAGLVDII